MFFIIARVMEQGIVVGYKMLNTDKQDRYYNYECGVYTTEKIENALRSGFKIENATLVDNKIKGVGGSLNRYSPISTSGELIGELSLIILSKKDDYYRISDPSGRVASMKEIKLIERAKRGMRLANSKLCTKGNGTEYISAIEGEIAEEREIIKYNSRKKFKIMTYSKDDERFERYYTRGKEFKAKFSYNNPDINYETVVKKFGRVYGNKEIHNEIFFGEGVSISIGVTELKYGEFTHFLMQIDSKTFLVEDILYIGNKWESSTRPRDTSSSVNDNHYIVALGQIGLMVMVGSGTRQQSLSGATCQYFKDKAQRNEGIGKIELICIPYCKIDTVEKLTNSLVYYGITCGMLDKSDAIYILKTAQNAVYRLNFDIDLATAPSSNVVEISRANNSESLLEMGIITGINFKYTTSLYSSMIPKYMQNVITCELSLIMREYGPAAYFSHYDELLLSYNNIISSINYSDNDRITTESIKLKYIVYYCLYKLGLADKLNEAWISESMYTELDKLIIYANVIGDTFVVVMGSNRRVYDLSKLLTELEEDKKQLDMSSRQVKKLNSKIALLGGYISLNDEGYIYDWENEAEIKQTDNIKGIIVSSQNRSTKIYVYITQNFDVVVNQSVFGNSMVYCIYDNKLIDEFVDRLTDIYVKYSIGISLDQMKAEELDTLISAMLRQAIPDKLVVINGLTLTVDAQLKELTCSSLIKNAGKLFDTTPFQLDRYTIKHKDRMSVTEKSKFLNMCINSVPRRYRVEESTYIRMLKEIIKAVCTDEEKESVLNGLSAWLLKQ